MTRPAWSDDRWQRKFDNPIETADGTRLNTLREAITYLARLPRFRSVSAPAAPYISQEKGAILAVFIDTDNFSIDTDISRSCTCCRCQILECRFRNLRKCERNLSSLRHRNESCR